MEQHFGNDVNEMHFPVVMFRQRNGVVGGPKRKLREIRGTNNALEADHELNSPKNSLQSPYQLGFAPKIIE
jgi:hypothetical protein